MSFLKKKKEFHHLRSESWPPVKKIHAFLSTWKKKKKVSSICGPCGHPPGGRKMLGWIMWRRSSRTTLMITDARYVSHVTSRAWVYDDRYGCLIVSSSSDEGLQKPVGTGPVWPVTSQTGPVRFRFGPVPNRPKFIIWIWIQKNEKFLKILQGATILMVSNFLKNSFV